MTLSTAGVQVTDTADRVECTETTNYHYLVHWGPAKYI